jgi:hypothetical protein
VRRRELLIVAATAWAGMVLAHVLAYALAYPAAAHRDAHLLATGHGWLPAALASLLGVVPVAVALTAVRALRSSGRPLSTRWLAAIQVAGYLVVEVAERGLDMAAAIADPAVLAGIAVQVVVAGLASLALRGVTRTTRALAQRRRRVPRPDRITPRPAPGAAPATGLTFLLGARRRAPPSLLAH